MPNILSLNFPFVVLATFLASVVSTSLAFGFGIVLVSLIHFFVPPVPMVVLVITLGLINCLMRVVETRQVRTGGIALWTGLSGILGVPAGVWLLHIADATALKRYCSVIILLAAGLLVNHGCTRPSIGARSVADRWLQVTLGSLGGFIGGFSGLSGPPLVFCSLVQRWDKMLAHAVLARYFVAINAIGAAALVVWGLYEWSMVLACVVLIPAVAAGFYVGTWLRNRIPEKQFRRATMGFLILSSVGGFLNTFWTLG